MRCGEQGDRKSEAHSCYFNAATGPLPMVAARVDFELGTTDAFTVAARNDRAVARPSRDRKGVGCSVFLQPQSRRKFTSACTSTSPDWPSFVPGLQRHCELA